MTSKPCEGKHVGQPPAADWWVDYRSVDRRRHYCTVCVKHLSRVGILHQEDVDGGPL